MSRSRRSRLTDPEPPDDFHAVQGRDAVRLFWDQPDYDGGAEVLAYAVDWMPEPPPFPIFVSADDESMDIHGLRAGVTYRARVKALNRVDDSMPAIQRIAMDHTLVRYRSYDPFTGSIANGRATVLKNTADLPGFEISADAESIFWGDSMAVAVREQDPTNAAQDLADQAKFRMASEVYGVNVKVNSRRKRFDDSTGSYVFVKPIRICLAPLTSQIAADGSHSIARFSDENELLVLDGTPSEHGNAIKICAQLEQIDLGRTTFFAIVQNRRLDMPHEEQLSAPSRRSEVSNALALILMVVGSASIVFGMKAIR